MRDNILEMREMRVLAGLCEDDGDASIVDGLEEGAVDRLTAIWASAKKELKGPYKTDKIGAIQSLLLGLYVILDKDLGEKKLAKKVWELADEAYAIKLKHRQTEG